MLVNLKAEAESLRTALKGWAASSGIVYDFLTKKKVSCLMFN